MPPKNKVTPAITIEQDQLNWLKEIASRFDFPDESKSLRVLLDYAIKDADADEVFAPENMRCRHCAG